MATQLIVGGKVYDSSKVSSPPATKATYQSGRTTVEVGQVYNPPESGWIWPTTGEGSKHINQWVSNDHLALDFNGKLGSPVLAVTGGKVLAVIPNEKSGYGNLVIQQLPDGRTVYYAHLSQFAVKPGDMLAAGQPLGTLGSTGNSTGPHLHLEFRDESGVPINPYSILGADLGGAAIAAPAESGFSYDLWSAQASQSEALKFIPSGGSSEVQMSSPSESIAPLWMPPGLALALGYEETPLAPLECSGTVLFETPFGDICLPEIPWLRIGAVVVGLIVLLMSINKMMEGSPIIDAGQKVVKAGIGAANPAAGLAAEIIS